jgi:predicted dehydrogenase
MTQHQIAFIGTGGRAVTYGMAYAQRDDARICAVVDPQAGHRAMFFERCGLAPDGVRQYDDFGPMLADHRDALDAVVIASPNHLHAEHAVPCLERGLAVALEKPLATTPEDCRRILDAERAHGGRTLLGFVLRSTPFYARIHELLGGGAIGRVISIQADELPGLGVSSVMARSPWRRYARHSGGAMLEKSCHDMDILNWLTHSRPVALDSFGDRRIFAANPFLPDQCDGCPIGNTCPYYRQPAVSDHEDQAEGELHRYTREDDRCIFNIDKDTVDVQSVMIAYENGALVNFMLNFHAMGPRAGRNFHAVGTRGRVWGNLHEATVWHHDNLTGRTTEHDCRGDGSGHGGGDRLHALQLLRMLEQPDHVPDANAAAGYLSAMMCFATDLSRTQGRRVHFAYDGPQQVRLV